MTDATDDEAKKRVGETPTAFPTAPPLTEAQIGGRACFQCGREDQLLVSTSIFYDDNRLYACPECCGGYYE